MQVKRAADTACEKKKMNETFPLQLLSCSLMTAEDTVLARVPELGDYKPSAASGII